MLTKDVELPWAAPEACAAPVFGRERTVLVIDGDAVSRRFAEHALEKIMRARIEAVKDGAAALDLLEHTLVDVIVADSALIDMSGVELLEKLEKDARLREIPLVFVSADARPQTKATMLRAGARDYLSKPCDRDELRARVDRILLERERGRERARNYVLAGDFTGMSFPDVVNLLEMGRRTGLLSLLTPRSSGRIYFEAGRIVHVRFGNLLGKGAFYRLMGEEIGQFEFVPDRVSLKPEERAAFPSAMALVMEGARLVDDWRARRGGADTREVFSPPVDGADGLPTPSGEGEPTVRLVPPQLVAGEAVARYEQTLADPYALAELVLLDEEALGAWTSSVEGRERVHVVLIADLAEGVSAMMAVASPVSAREMSRALVDGKKAMGVLFRLRRERVLDVILLDVHAPTAFLSGLRRTPALAVLAPPNGDFFGMGIAARVELDNLLNRLAPTALLAVGDASMESRLHELGSTLGRRLDSRCVRGVFGQGSCDLRTCLIEGLRLSGQITERFRAELGG